MSLFSVIIPIYNTEKYLHECIESVLNQQYKNIEVILVNDCSTDGCADICNSYKNNKLIAIFTGSEMTGPGDEKILFGGKVQWSEHVIFLFSFQNGILRFFCNHLIRNSELIN